VPDETIIARVVGRLTHPGSGRIYHRDFNPPKQEGFDDETGERLIQREDDREETIRERLAVYHAQTKPLIDYYQAKAAEIDSPLRFHGIDGVGDVDEIGERIAALLRDG
jgi:adenylate kinase